MCSKSHCANPAHGSLFSPQLKSIITLLCCSRVVVAEREKLWYFLNVCRTHTRASFFTALFFSYSILRYLTVGCVWEVGGWQFPIDLRLFKLNKNIRSGSINVGRLMVVFLFPCSGSRWIKCCFGTNSQFVVAVHSFHWHHQEFLLTKQTLQRLYPRRKVAHKIITDSGVHSYKGT